MMPALPDVALAAACRPGSGLDGPARAGQARRFHPAGAWQRENLGLVGTGISAQHKPDPGARQTTAGGVHGAEVVPRDPAARPHVRRQPRPVGGSPKTLRRCPDQACA